MTKYTGFNAGMVSGSLKAGLERDSGIRISFVSDGAFVLRALIKDNSGKIKKLEDNYPDVESLCDMIKRIVSKSINNDNDVSIISRRVLRGTEKKKAIDNINLKRNRIKRINHPSGELNG
jgi:hypothetical protein